MRLLVSFPPGIEDIVKGELMEKTSSCTVIEENPLGILGKLIVDVSVSKNSSFMLRSVNSLSEHVGYFKIGRDKTALEKIYEEITRMVFPESFPEASSFRVTCERRGRHEYRGIEVEKVAGQAIVDKYSLKVDLKNFEVNVLIEIIEDACFVGLFRDDYVYSRYIVFNHPDALKPSIAYAMIRLADLKPGMTVLDPMCGGGTIPIETALTVSRVKIYGFDISEHFLEGAALNSEAMSVGDKILFKKIDCRKLSHFLKFKVDRIITDPPYGTKPRISMEPYTLYDKCLPEMGKVLADEGRIVLITLKPDYVKEVSLEAGLKVKHERDIKFGFAYPRIMILKH